MVEGTRTATQLSGLQPGLPSTGSVTWAWCLASLGLDFWPMNWGLKIYIYQFSSIVAGRVRSPWDCWPGMRFPPGLLHLAGLS